jgi:hypothetical protein
MFDTMKFMSRVNDLLECGEELLAALDDSAGELSAAELGELSVGLIGIADRLAARQALLVRDGEYAGTHELDGSTSMTAWLALHADTSKARTGQFTMGRPPQVSALTTRPARISVCCTPQP